MSLSALENDLDGEQLAPDGATPLRLDVLGPQGETLRSLDLTQPVLTIGQASGNQLVLEAEGVSRFHLRIARAGARVTVTDLGGRTGTLLNEQRLPPHVETPMALGAILRVGPFRLRLVEPRSASTATTTVVQSVAYGALTLTISGGRETLELTPGQPVVVVAMLANNGSAPDSAALSVEGIPAEWVRLPEGTVTVQPGTPLSLPLQILVPREPESRAREYGVTLRARAQSSSEISAVNARWTVLPFSGSTLDVRPQKRIVRGTANATYTLAIQNSGNQPASFALRAGEDEPSLDYQLGQNRITLEPGASASISLGVQARENPSSPSQSYNFSVRAQPSAGTPLLATAQLTQQRPFPVWMIPAIALGVILLIASASTLIWWLGRSTRVSAANQAGITQVASDVVLGTLVTGEMSVDQSLQFTQTAIALANQVNLQQTQLAQAVDAARAGSEPTIQALAAALNNAQAAQTAQVVQAAQAAQQAAAAQQAQQAAQQAAQAVQAAQQAAAAQAAQQAAAAQQGAAQQGAAQQQQAQPTYTPYPTYTPAPTSTSVTVVPTANAAATPTNPPVQVGSKLVFTKFPISATAGMPLNPAPVVQIQRADGSPDTSYTGVVSLNIQPNQCVSQSSNLPVFETKYVPFVNGLATFDGLVINCADDFQLQATVDKLFLTSDSFNVQPGTPATLMFVTSPKSARAESNISAVTVRVLDPYGNTVKSYSEKITLKITDGSGNASAVLSGPKSKTPTNNNGEVTFGSTSDSTNQLSIDRVGSAYTLTAFSGSIQGTSRSFNITANRLTFVVPPGNIPALSTTLTTSVNASDRYGTPDPSFNSPITLTLVISGTTGATLKSENGLVRSAVAGSASFDKLNIDYVGTYQLRAAADGVDGKLEGTSAPFYVTAGRLSYTAAPITGLTAGTPLTITVQADDALGHVDSSLNTRCDLKFYKFGVTTPASTWIWPIINGVLRITAVNDVFLKEEGFYTLETSCGGSPVTSPLFEVKPAIVDHLAVAFAPSLQANPINFRATDTFTVTVSVKNRFGGVSTGFSGTVNLRLTNGITISTPPQDMRFGTAVFTVQVTKASGADELYQLMPVLVTGTLPRSVSDELSRTFTISPGPAYSAVFTQSPAASIKAGDQFSVSIGARDKFNNTTTFTSTEQIALAVTPNTGVAGAGIQGTTSQAATGSSLIFSGLVITKAVDLDDLTRTDSLYTLTATTTSGVMGTSASFNVKDKGVTKKFVIQPLTFATATPGSYKAGEWFSVEVRAVDEFGNTVKVHTGSILIRQDQGKTLTCQGQPQGFASGRQIVFCMLETAGTAYTLTATDPVPASVVQESAPSTVFEVRHGAANHLTFTSIQTTYTVRENFDITVQIRDIFENVVTSYPDPAAGNPTTMSLGISSDTGRGLYGNELFQNGSSLASSYPPGTATATATIQNGVAVFRQLSMERVKYTNLPQYILEAKVLSTPILSAKSPEINLFGGSAVYIYFSPSPSSGLVGATLNTPPVRVQAYDQYYNPAGPGQAIHLVQFSGASTSFTGIDATLDNDGLATFRNLSFNATGVHQLTARVVVSPTIMITSNNFTIYNNNQITGMTWLLSPIKYSYESNACVVHFQVQMQGTLGSNYDGYGESQLSERLSDGSVKDVTSGNDTWYYYSPLYFNSGISNGYMYISKSMNVSGKNFQITVASGGYTAVSTSFQVSFTGNPVDDCTISP